MHLLVGGAPLLHSLQQETGEVTAPEQDPKRWWGMPGPGPMWPSLPVSLAWLR